MLGETIMFDRLGHVTFHHRRLVLALAGAFLAVGALWGTGVFGSMVSSGFETPGSESARAQTQTEATVGRAREERHRGNGHVRRASEERAREVVGGGAEG